MALLLGTLRLRGGRLALASTLGLLAVSLLWQRWMIITGAGYERVYFGFGTRCSCLLIG